MCAAVTEGGSHGISRLQVCVDCRVAPSGSVIVIGSVSTMMLITGAPCTMKWLVAPESLMACCSGMLLVGVVEALCAQLVVCMLLLLSSLASSSCSVSTANELKVGVGVGITGWVER